MKRLILCLCLLYSGLLQAKQGILKGTLRDEKAQPVAGATIRVLRTGEQSISDNKGNFQLLAVLPADSLIVTSSGYKTAMLAVQNRSHLEIDLQPLARELEEVVLSTGYETIPRERVTGSFSKIDEKLFNEQVGTTVLERLPFLASGLSANTAAITAPGRVSPSNGLVLRGISTMTSSISNPLIILDNFPYEGNLNNINPNDIESVTLLKDAAAASIWGAQAGNGVIVITTKKSRFDSDVRISLAMNASLRTETDLFSIPQIGSGSIVELEKFLFSRGYNLADTANINRYPLTEAYSILLQQRRGQITASEADALLEGLKQRDVRNDFARYFYQPAIEQQYALNIQGGSQRHSWLIAAGWDNNQSELDDRYRRTTIRWNNSYKITSRLQLSTNISYARSQNRNGNPSYGNLGFVRQSLPLYTRLADEQGNAVPLYHQYNKEYLDTAGAGLLYDWRYFPLTDYQFQSVKTNLSDINANISLNYKIGNSLLLDVKYRYQEQEVYTENLQGPEAYYTRNYINSFSQIDRATGKVTYPVPPGGIIDRSRQKIRAQDIRGQINFNKRWGRHSVAAIAGGQISETINNGDTYRAYGYNADYLTYGNVDYVNRYPDFVTGSSTGIFNPASFTRTNKRVVSLYTNGSYTYADRYAITLSARRDASNLFGVAVNNLWKPLWSGGLAWTLSREPFFRTTWIDELKLRATYGTQGNSDPSRVAVTTFRYASAPNPYTQTPYSEIENAYNPSLRWEQVAMMNAALDFSILNRRIAGSIEHYRKYISDLYDAVLVDPTIGLQRDRMVQNVAQMRGHGWDIDINTVNIDKQFKWSSNFNLSFYSDKITERKVKQIASNLTSGGGVENYSVYAFFAYRWGGLDPQTGDPIGYLDKAPSKDYLAIVADDYPIEDMVYIGSLNPTFFGSFGNNFQWKRWSLATRIVYKMGYYFKRNSISYGSLVSGKRGHPDYELRWQNPGDEAHTQVPSFVYPVASGRDILYLNSEALVTKGDHIRLQYVNISYQFPSRKGSRGPFREAQVFFVANNIGLLWKANKLGLDPDYYQGPDPRRTYSIGTRIQF